MFTKICFLSLLFGLMSIIYIGYDIGKFESSSIWCVYDIRGNKLCTLKNVLYNETTFSFDFYWDRFSVIHGLKSYKDLQKIQLSSVKNHNRFYANFTFDLTGYKNCSKKIRKLMAMSRFKPDNLMHVIHDDLLPLFITMEELCIGDWDVCLRDLSIMFLDDHDLGPYSFLYTLFTNNLILRKDVTHSICIEELHLGLDLVSIWYQYGFAEPRGPLQDIFINEGIFLRFKKFILRRLSIAADSGGNHALILRRELTRKILNVEKISKFWKEFNGEAALSRVASVTPYDTRSLIQHVIATNMLIGMHGAEMILALFLPMNSTVIELFPYGISPRAVSFLKPIAEYCHINYVDWTNDDLKLTVRHPEFPPYLGGLGHLTEEERAGINNLRFIEYVYCCDDPKFLHFMYQDTTVGDSFREVLLKAKLASNAVTNRRNEYFFPTRLNQVECFINSTGVFFSWRPPDNVDPSTVKYSIVAQLDTKQMGFVTQEISLSVQYPNVSSASAWISSSFIDNQHTSSDTFVHCH